MIMTKMVSKETKTRVHYVYQVESFVYNTHTDVDILQEFS